MRKLSKIFAVVAVIMCIFVMSVSASAAYFSGTLSEDYSVPSSSKTLTSDQASKALCIVLDITNEELEASGLQVWASMAKSNVVEVWEDGNLVEVIYRDDNGNIIGLVSGPMILGNNEVDDDSGSSGGGSSGGGPSSGGSSGGGRLSNIIDDASDLLTVIGNVATFIVGNDLCLLTLGFVFVARAVVLVRKTIRVTPR